MIIHKYITHILSKESDEPILNDFEGKINPQIDKFLQSTIKKVTNDDLLRRAKFLPEKHGTIRQCCEAIIHNENTFIENSKEIAAYLFEIMKCSSEIDSCDLVVCFYTVKDQTRVAIIKLDYKPSYNHFVEFENDKFNIQMRLNKEIIPDSKKPKQCALVGLSSLYGDLLVIDKRKNKCTIWNNYGCYFTTGYEDGMTPDDVINKYYNQ